MKEYVPGAELELPEDHEYTKITFFPVIFMLRGKDKEDGATEYEYEKKLMSEFRRPILPGAPCPMITFPVGNRVVGVEAYGMLPNKKYDEKPLAKFKFSTLYDMAMEELSLMNERGGPLVEEPKLTPPVENPEAAPETPPQVVEPEEETPAEEETTEETQEEKPDEEVTPEETPEEASEEE